MSFNQSMSDKKETQYLKTGRSKSPNQQHRDSHPLTLPAPALVGPPLPSPPTAASRSQITKHMQGGQSSANVTNLNASDAGATEITVSFAPPKQTEPSDLQRNSRAVPKAPASQPAFCAEEQAKQSQLKAILNKRITPQNFKKMFELVKAVNIDNAITLTGVVSQIYDKALMEPTFCETYAKLCFHLAAELPDFSEDNNKITFKRLLARKCQEEFERGLRGEREQEETNKADEEGEVKQSEEEREEKRIKARRRIGNIRLIGELYKNKMLTERIMLICIEKLSAQQQTPDEEDIEVLCNLMSTIGETTDHWKAKGHMDAHFERMASISNNMKLSSRVRFMLKDIVDLRKYRLQQRRKVKGPKKIEEVHRDSAQERHAHSTILGRRTGINLSPRMGAPMDFSPRGSAMLSPQMSDGMGNNEVAFSKPSRSERPSAPSQYTEFSGTTSNHEGVSVDNTGGGGNIENIGGGGDSLAVSGSEDKPLPEPSRTKSTTSKAKKKRNDILSKTEAARVSSDLYGAYKNPEDKKDFASSESVESTSTSIMSKQEAAGSSQQVAIVRDEGTPSKAEPDDWEDAADISKPKLGTSDSGEQACGDRDGSGHGAKKYSRNFLLKFSMQFLPEGFEFMSDIAEILNANVNASPSVNYDSLPSPGRIIDRPGRAAKLDRRGIGMIDDNRWSNGGNALPELSRTKSTTSKWKKKKKEILSKSAAAMIKSDQSSASDCKNRIPTPAREQGAALTQNVPSEKSEEHLRNMSLEAIKEFYSARDEKEVALCIEELNSPSFHPSMIYLWVTDSLFERKDAERDLLAKLLVNLAKSQDGTFSQSQLIKGFETVLSILEDAVIDAPRAPEFLGLIFARVILENVVSLNQIGQLIHQGGEEPGHLLEVGLAGNVLGNILEIIKLERGESFLNEIHTSSNLRLETFRPPDPLKSRILEKFI